RQEEVADILRAVIDLVLVADVAAVIRARNHAAENVHEHGKAGALVGADRQHHAAQGGLGIAGRMPVGVERIAEGALLAAALRARPPAATYQEGREGGGPPGRRPRTDWCRAARCAHPRAAWPGTRC